MVKVIWHKTASPPQTGGSIVFARWRQCAHMGGHIGATWRLRLNRPSAAAMQCYVKLLWPLWPLIIIIMWPHRSTTYVDAAYCYRPSSVVCLIVGWLVVRWSVGLSRSWTLQKRLNRSRCRLGYGFVWAQGSMCQMGMHIDATWRIRLNRPCATAMWPFCRMTLTSCYYWPGTLTVFTIVCIVSK